MRWTGGCLVAALLGSVAGCATPEAAPPWDGPRQVACSDGAHLGLAPETVSTPAVPVRRSLWGLTVLPPSGSNWCLGRQSLSEAQAAALPTTVLFAKNLYGDRLFTAPPTAEEGSHTFIAYVLVREFEDPMTVQVLREVMNEPDPDILVMEVADTDEFPAQCLRTHRTSRHEGSFLLDEDGYACIHPHDPRVVVLWAASESYREGAANFTPFLIEFLRPEYDAFLKSVEFTQPPS